MPITKITIENFKGIRERIEIPLRPITLLFGANSAGKSTILQALLYLRELLERQNSDADRLISGGDSIDLGGFRQFVHGHDLDRAVTIGITVSVDDDGLPVYPVSVPWTDPHDFQSSLAENGLMGIQEVSIEVQVAWSPEIGGPWIQAYHVLVNGRLLGRIVANPGYGANLVHLDHRHPIFLAQFDADEVEADSLNPMAEVLAAVMISLTRQQALFADEGFVDVAVGARVVPEWGRALSLTGADREFDQLDLRYAEFILSNLMVGSGELVLRELQKSRYLGPLRSVPERQFNAQRSPSSCRWTDGTAAWDLLFKDVEGEHGLIDRVSRSLTDSEHLGMGYSMEGRRVIQLPENGLEVLTLQKLAADPENFDAEDDLRQVLADLRDQPVDTRLTITDLAKGIAVDACDIGSGVSQVIPVLVSVLHEGSRITAIEQPELHIHPAVQCALGDVFIREVRRTPERLFLIETHSEHLLLRMMRRIRQTLTGALPSPDLALKPEDITILFVEIVEGRSVYREMPLNERGELVMAWPGGFFEEDLNELM